MNYANITNYFFHLRTICHVFLSVAKKYLQYDWLTVGRFQAHAALSEDLELPSFYGT